MNAEALLQTLLRLNLLAGLAIVVVAMLRPWVLRRAGARLTYWLWLAVPVVVLASLLPAPERILRVAPAADIALAADLGAPASTTLATPAVAAVNAAAAPWVSRHALAEILVAAWLLTALVLLLRSILHTRRCAADPALGPALIGVFRPRLLLPADFAARFDAEERSLILAHEEVHRVSRHTAVNALLEVIRCACWFNPLVHFAALLVRTDQELACDAAVIAAHPAQRRAYAQALLKAQLLPGFLPLGCSWTSRSARRLAERIALLARSAPSRRGALTGAVFIAVCGCGMGYAAWAQQPDRVVTQTLPPAAAWTPSANAPGGTLTHELEARRHDSFIKLARQGGIDFVLFGTTDAEMFQWPDRGRAVWDRTFAALKAVDFGSQGTRPTSLLWRMRNGELDGYHAKLVVLQTAFCFNNDAGVAGSGSDTSSVIAANCAPILAEIRARQPQAKILVLPPFPRGQQDREPWRQVARDNAAAFAPLVDNKTIFYADFGERFFLTDGTHNQELWRFRAGPPNVGIQTKGFEVWADALQPWLDRFVR